MPKKKQSPSTRKRVSQSDPLFIRTVRSLSETWASVPTALLHVTRRGIVAKPVSYAHADDFRQVARRAKELRFWLKQFDIAREANDTQRMLDCAFRLGVESQKLSHWTAKSGERSALARQGGKACDKSDPKRMLREVAERMRLTGNSWTQCCKEVAPDFGVSGKTVQRHTEELNPKKRKRF